MYVFKILLGDAFRFHAVILYVMDNRHAGGRDGQKS